MSGSTTRPVALRPCCANWQVLKSPGVEPLYTGPHAKTFAPDYGVARLKFHSGHVRDLDTVDRVIRGMVPMSGPDLAAILQDEPVLFAVFFEKSLPSQAIKPTDGRLDV